MRALPVPLVSLALLFVSAAAFAQSGAAGSGRAATVEPAGWDSPDGAITQKVWRSGRTGGRASAGMSGPSVTPSGPTLADEIGPSPLCSLGAATLLVNEEAPEGDTPMAVAFTPDGTKIVVAHRESQNLVVFDAATQTVLMQIAVTGSPNDLRISSDGVHAVTANIWEDTASVVDLVAGTELGTVAVGAQPGLVRITPDGDTAVIGNTEDDSLSVVDIATRTELRRIAGTGFVSIVRLTSEPGVVTATFSGFECVDDVTVIHPDYDNDEIDFFDITTGGVVSVASDPDPRGIAITPDGSTAVVSHFLGARKISVIDTATKTITKTITTSDDLNEPIAINPAGTKAVAAIQNAAIVVDLVTDAISPSLNTASLNGLHTTADGLHALGVGFRGALISFASETVVKELNNVVNTYHGAVSPVGDRGAMLANHNGECMVVVDTDGASGFTEAVVPTGPPDEADKTRMVAITPDGTTAVTTNVLSDNASIIDLGTGSVTALVPLGDRPARVRITPDGSKAVVANLDSTFVTIVDIGGATATNVTTSTRNSEVEISPDGQYAYVAVVVADGVWRVDLNTASVDGPKLTTGNMGGVSYGFNQASGMALSHDGATLVTCDSFSDTVTVIDTAAWSVVATVGVGDLPARAIFSADDSTLYVTNRSSSTVSVVDIAGGSSSLLDTIAVGDWPFEMALAPDGETLFVANYLNGDVGVVDLSTGTMTSTIDLGDRVQGLHLNEEGTCLYVATGTWSVTLGSTITVNQSGALTLVDAGSGAIVDQLVTGLPPATLAADPLGGFLLVASPFGDGLTRVILP